jgi:hypothetical protein
MARYESEGNKHDTMVTTNCEKSTRPHNTNADHNTWHDNRPRSQWTIKVGCPGPETQLVSRESIFAMETMKGK